MFHTTSLTTRAITSPNFVSPSPIYILSFSLEIPPPSNATCSLCALRGQPRSLNTQDRNRKGRMRVPLLQRRRWKKPRETSISASLGGRIRAIKACALYYGYSRPPSYLMSSRPTGILGSYHLNLDHSVVLASNLHLPGVVSPEFVKWMDYLLSSTVGFQVMEEHLCYPVLCGIIISSF